MTASKFSGALIVAGSMFGGVPGGAIPPDYNIGAGPSMFYKGVSFPDPRFAPLNKDNILVGTVRGHFCSAAVYSVNAVPAAFGAAKIAGAQLPTSGTPFTLAAASWGISTGVPFVNAAGGISTANLMLDFGFDTISVTSGSKTATPVGSMERYFVGMPLVIANVGNAGATTALLTFITAVGTTTITLNDAAQATNSTANVGTGNAWGNLTGQGLMQTTGAQPYIADGPGLFLDPTQNIARGISITGLSGGAGGVVNVVGTDLYGATQTEAITVAAGATVAYSNKCYKTIQSVTPAFTDASHNYTVGTSDLFGFAYRSDQWEAAEIFWNGAAMTSSTGWVAGDTTSPATTTTKDVRGAVQTSAQGPLGAGIGTNNSSGTTPTTGRRLVVAEEVPFLNLGRANIINAAPLFGVTPV